MSLDLTDHKSMLAQVMAWWYTVRQQATAWANTNSGLHHHMASQDHNELKVTIFMKLLRNN